MGRKRKTLEQNAYVVITRLPPEQQEPFRKWLDGQTVPIVPEEGIHADDCAWSHDYRHWLSNWLDGRDAPVMD